jgi:hypothetical protein
MRSAGWVQYRALGRAVRMNVWLMDFVSDCVITGRVIRMLTVADECTRECPVIEVAPAPSTQFVGLSAASRVCTHTSGDEAVRKASTGMLEQEIQSPSPAPDLIPAEHQPRTYIQIGTTNGGTSLARFSRQQRHKMDHACLGNGKKC